LSQQEYFNSRLSGQALISKNGQYYAIMKTDGNFVVYQATIPNVTLHHGDKALWHTDTAHKGKGPNRLVLQTDGNLSVLDSTNTIIFSTWTEGYGTPPYRLTLENDGNLVLYDSNSYDIWSSGFTSGLDGLNIKN